MGQSSWHNDRNRLTWLAVATETRCSGEEDHPRNTPSNLATKRVKNRVVWPLSMHRREQHALNCAKCTTMENTETNGGAILAMQSQPCIHTACLQLFCSQVASPKRLQECWMQGCLLHCKAGRSSIAQSYLSCRMHSRSIDKPAGFVVCTTWGSLFWSPQTLFVLNLTYSRPSIIDLFDYQPPW